MSETAAACQAIEEDLSALIDEELSPEREAELRAHLETCDRCAGRLEELCNVDLVLASLPAPEVESDLRAQLAGRIAEHERRAPPSAVSGRREGRPRAAWRGPTFARLRLAARPLRGLAWRGPAFARLRLAARPLRGLAWRGPAFARLRLAARPLRGLAPPPRTRRWLGRRVAALAAAAAAVMLVVFATLRSGETPAPDTPQIARPAPQALPAQGPEPGAERRGEPLLAEQRSLEPAPALVEPAPLAQPEAEAVEIAEVPPSAPVEIAETPPAPAAGLEDLSEEDLAMLLVLDAVEDLDVIANLELLEDLLEFEGTEGAG